MLLVAVACVNLCVRLPDLCWTQTKCVYSKQHLQVWKTRPAKTRIGTRNWHESVGTAESSGFWSHEVNERMARVPTRSDDQLLTQSEHVYCDLVITRVIQTHNCRVCLLCSVRVKVCVCAEGCVCPEAQGVSLAMCVPGRFQHISLNERESYAKILQKDYSGDVPKHIQIACQWLIYTHGISDYHFYIP